MYKLPQKKKKRRQLFTDLDSGMSSDLDCMKRKPYVTQLKVEGFNEKIKIVFHKV